MKRYFYKYYDALTAKYHVLTNNTWKWSTPLEFNDPFDNQFTLQVEDINKHLIEELYQMLINSNWDFFKIRTADLTILGSTLKQIVPLHLSKNQRANLYEALTEGVNVVKERLPAYQTIFKIAMRGTSILCLTETHDNILMWSHYANKHTGIAIKFTPTIEMDSPLQLAKPVRYSETLPQLKYKDFLHFSPIEMEKQVTKLVELYTLTKSIDWSYEKEWRVVSRLRDQSKVYEVIPFSPQDIEAVYLGCNIKKQDKEEIIEIVRSKYPLVKIYQASKHPTQFSLEFKSIDSNKTYTHSTL